ncbi:MAG: hypothetical protein OEY28_00050 [Nitrospira sp.]|nr:hypothetical protein [Nitrospira sp.]
MQKQDTGKVDPLDAILADYFRRFMDIFARACEESPVVPAAVFSLFVRKPPATEYERAPETPGFVAYHPDGTAAGWHPARCQPEFDLYDVPTEPMTLGDWCESQGLDVANGADLSRGKVESDHENGD